MTQQKYLIDKRHISIILFQKLYKPAVFFILIGLLLLWERHPDITGLSNNAHDTLGIFFLCVILWITNLIPPAITGFTGIVLLVISKALRPEEVYQMFFTEPVFFILSAFAIAAGMRKTGVARRITLWFISLKGRLPLRARLYIMSAVLSMLMPEYAVAAMLIPIVLESGTGYKKSELVSVMWGTQIGGLATLLGGARGPLTIAILKATKGIDISFLQWSAAAFPVALILLIIGYWIISLFFKDENKPAIELGNPPGIIRFEEMIMLGIVILTVTGWILYGTSVGLAGIGLIAIIMLFVFGILKVEDLTRRIDWSIIIMYGSAISIGFALNKTGGATWLGTYSSLIFPGVISTTIGLFFIAVIMTEFVSHSAVVAALLPVGIGMSERLGINPVIMSIGIGLASGMAFIFPFSSPGNMIAYSSGAIKLKDLALPGFIMLFISIIILFLAVEFYYPVLGYGKI